MPTRRISCCGGRGVQALGHRRRRHRCCPSPLPPPPPDPCLNDPPPTVTILPTVLDQNGDIFSTEFICNTGSQLVTGGVPLRYQITAQFSEQVTGISECGTPCPAGPDCPPCAIQPCNVQVKRCPEPFDPLCDPATDPGAIQQVINFVGYDPGTMQLTVEFELAPQLDAVLNAVIIIGGARAGSCPIVDICNNPLAEFRCNFLSVGAA